MFAWYLIEVYIRPAYVKPIYEKLKKNIILYYHNDPLSMSGSQSVNERKYLLNKCKSIIVISEWIKKRLLKDLDANDDHLQKIFVIPHSTNKINNTNLIKRKKNYIIFVGKLNSQKGYDIFGNVIVKILKKNKNWRGIVIGCLLYTSPSPRD